MSGHDKVSAGRYELSFAQLTGPGGSKDITALVGRLDIEESIYSYYATYKFYVVDGINMFEELNLTGNEFLTFSADIKDENNTTKNTVSKALRVISYESYVRTQGASAYVIHAMDVTAFLAMTKRVNKSMEGTCRDILEALLTEVGYTPYDLKGDNSVGNHKVVFPNTSYMESWEMMIRKGYSPDGSTYHLYETVWGEPKNLHTWKSMVEGSKIEDYYYRFNLQNEVALGTAAAYKWEEQSIKQMTTQLNLANSDVSYTGGNTAKFHEFDISKKFYEITQFDIIEEGGGLPKLLSKHMLDPMYGTGGPEGKSFLRTSNEMAYSDKGELFDLQEFSPEGKNLMKKNAVVQNSFAEIHTLTVAGNDKVYCGGIVEVTVPKTADPEEKSGTDLRMSGKYLVTEVKHEFADDYKYIMRVKVQRDSRQK